MSETQPPHRPNRREVAAAATREEVLRAARRLFVEHGYAATTINQVAAEAGVAVQTVYSSVGGKP
ncbi:MAG TPA: helix-turn-helix domain-containing protein, partial [Marmoricola sp.]